MEEAQKKKILKDVATKLDKVGYVESEIPEIDGVKPDLMCVRHVAARRVMKIAVKIEDEATIATESAKETMHVLANWADKFASRKVFVCVPTGNGPDAKQHLSKYNEFYEYEV